MVLSQDLAGRKSTIAAVPVDFFEMERRGTTARTEILAGADDGRRRDLHAGLALHPIVKVAAGRAREVRPGAWVLAAMSFLYYGFGIPH